MAWPTCELDWFERQLEAKYELSKGGRFGPGSQDLKEGRVLNRIIRWTARGLEYEADPRQVERLIADLELEGPGVKTSPTPGVKPLPEQIARENKLPVDEITRYRAVAARANYLAADRPDAQFAAKEACRFMSAPTDLAWQSLKRFGRYLKGRKRVV